MTQKKITNRQFEIIEAAGKIMTTSGVSGLTIKKLAKEIKLSEGAIYRHFESKEDIIVGMLEFLADKMFERLKEVTNSSKPEEQFKALFQEQFRYFKANPHYVVAVFSDGLFEESIRINEGISKIMVVKRSILLPIIKSGQASGVFTSAISSEDMTQIVIGTFRLQMYKWRLANFEFDVVENGTKRIESILKIIKAK